MSRDDDDILGKNIERETACATSALPLSLFPSGCTRTPDVRCFQPRVSTPRDTTGWSDRCFWIQTVVNLQDLLFHYFKSVLRLENTCAREKFHNMLKRCSLLFLVAIILAINIRSHFDINFNMTLCRFLASIFYFSLHRVLKALCLIHIIKQREDKKRLRSQLVLIAGNLQCVIHQCGFN